MSLTLYSDRMSHPVRACLLFLRANNVNFKEQKLNLMKGEHLRHPDLPCQTVPTLICHNSDSSRRQLPEKLVLSQSTTILRFLGANYATKDSWYADPKIRFKIDEFFDFYQCSLNAAVVKGVRNTLFYKVLFKLSEPNKSIVNEALAEYDKAQNLFKDYYLQDKKFIGGTDICVGDLLAAMTFEQAKLFAEGQLKTELEDYLKEVSEAVGGYDDLLREIREIPAALKAMDAI